MAGRRPHSAQRPVLLVRLIVLLVCVLCVRTTSCAVIVVIYEASDQQQFARVLQKSVNEANAAIAMEEDRASAPGASRRVWMSIVSAVVEEGQSTARTIRDLCATLDNNSVSAVVSLAREPGATLAAVTVAAYAGIPVLGHAPGYAERHYKDLSPLFQALNPSLEAMADATAAFLLTNGWLSSTYVTDDSETSASMGTALADRLRRLHEHAVLTSVALPRGASPSKVFDALADVFQRRSRVLVVHCTSPRLTVHLFEQARRLDMISGRFIWMLLGDTVPPEWTRRPPQSLLPTGVLHLRFRSVAKTGKKHVLRTSLRLLARALIHATTWSSSSSTTTADALPSADAASCWFPPGPSLRATSQMLFRELSRLTSAAILGSSVDVGSGRSSWTWSGSRPAGSLWDRRDGGGLSAAADSLRATVDLLNLVESDGGANDGDSDDDDNFVDPGGIRPPTLHWRPMGNVSAGRVKFDAVVWPGNKLTGPSPLEVAGRWRVVGALAPPFVMTSEPLGNHSCLVGVPCLRVHTAVKEELVAACTDFARGDPPSAGGRRDEGRTYNVTCCHGYSVDLLVNTAKELRLDYVFYLAADNRFGSMRVDGRWDGIVGDLMSGAAHLAFAPLSVTAARIQHVDFSTPYYFSGVSFLTSTKFRDVPLLAFLAPFSPGLWIAIFGCLHVIAVTAAIYEWLSPFGLNPWGRQRTKNFSLASALWVTWSLLFSHLVAFKAPKSWPNKVLINLWGCFSVIFLASYTANIAALFAGLFFQTTVNDFNDQSLLTQRVGTARGTAGESYLATKHSTLYDHMRSYTVNDFDDGVIKLRNGDLDLLVGDTPVLDFYRGQEPGCTLRAVGPIMNEDSYAVGLIKGSPLKDPISSLIVKYNANGYLDYLTARWYHGLPCMRTTSEMYRPMRLSIDAVAGVFIMLCLGVAVGLIILCLEHVFYKHALPDLRAKPKGTVWRSPNLMFFSQKLYRFINCVELVSPHHSAKELVNNLRTGQITSLFQKSIKRKEQDQRRRRKSKAQFFEMIQEIRRLRRTSKDKDAAPRSTTTASVASGPSARTASDPPVMSKIRFRLLSREDVHHQRPSSHHVVRVHRETELNQQQQQRQTQARYSTVRHHSGLQGATTSSRSQEQQRRIANSASDDSCARLIERVGHGSRWRGRTRRRSASSSDGSSNSGGAGRGHRRRSLLVPISTSLGELHSGTSTVDEDHRRPRRRLQRVRSYDGSGLSSRTSSALHPLASASTASMSSSSSDDDDGRLRPRHRHQRSRRSSVRRKQPPMTKFDFFDLPLRLNDERLERLSKEDIVLLWQNAERELRRRLRMALAEKHDLEKRLKAAALSQKPP